MTPKQAERRIVKAFTAMEVAYVAIEDVAREYPLPAELVQEVVDCQVAWHRSVRRLRQIVEQEAPPPGVEMTVDSETFDAIAQMIESPPEPTTELKRLMGASAPWDDASEQEGKQP